MEKFIEVAAIGEPNNRLVVFFKNSGECHEEHSGSIHIAADPNPSEQERVLKVSVRLTSDRKVCKSFTVRQLGNGSTKVPCKIHKGPELVEIVVAAEGTEKRPNDYAGID